MSKLSASSLAILAVKALYKIQTMQRSECLMLDLGDTWSHAVQNMIDCFKRGIALSDRIKRNNDSEANNAMWPAFPTVTFATNTL